MLRFFKNLFFGKSLVDALNETATIKAGGVKWVIRRLNVINHIQGISALTEYYATYERKKEIEKSSEINQSHEKLYDMMKKAYREVFLASVVSPKLTDKKESEGQFVDDLFTDLTMCHDLYSAIMDFTNKKKGKKLT